MIELTEEIKSDQAEFPAWCPVCGEIDTSKYPIDEGQMIGCDGCGVRWDRDELRGMRNPTIYMSERDKKLLSDIKRKLIAEDCRDLSDSEIERCLKNTIVPQELIKLAKQFRDNKILELKADDVR